MNMFGMLNISSIFSNELRYQSIGVFLSLNPNRDSVNLTKKLISFQFSNWKYIINQTLFFTCEINSKNLQFRKQFKNKMKAIAEHFHKFGYAVLPQMISPQACDEAVNEINRLIDKFQPTNEQLIAFSPETEAHFTDKYFKQSAANISFFFQTKALKNGKITVEKHHAINKIGHALHEHNPIFKKITFNNKIHQICQAIGILNPIVVQSMAILKPPKIGGQVPDHQDSTFLLGDPDTLVGFWIPLQDATLQNGCLWGIPGSHKGKLYKKSRHTSTKNYVQELNPIDFTSDQFVPIEMKKGSLAIFPGKFVHRSNDNLSDKSRYAYTWHLMDQSSKWADDNWLQRQKFPKLQRNIDEKVI